MRAAARGSPRAADLRRFPVTRRVPAALIIDTRRNHIAGYARGRTPASRRKLRKLQLQLRDTTHTHTHTRRVFSECAPSMRAYTRNTTTLKRDATAIIIRKRR